MACPLKPGLCILSWCRQPVYKIAWLAGKTPFECVSTSTDGQVLWWDVRKLAEPVEGLWVEEKTDAHQRLGATALEYTGVRQRARGVEHSPRTTARETSTLCKRC